jgi:2-methylcitrate dehydratase PrpD
MDLMGKIVKHILSTQFEDFPQEVVSVTKKSVIDTLGAMIGGSAIEGCKLLVDFLRHCGGRPESTVAVFGDKLPAALAAQANGAMARALEIDDVWDRRGLHPSASLVPTCLAICERHGNISGKEFVAALALGHDLNMRFSLAVNPVLTFTGRYTLFEVFAYTASAGKLLGLTEDQLWNAIGIAYSQMPGDLQAVADGVMTAYITQGTRSKAAIEAALMAERGITGTRNVLQGQYGFFRAFEPNPDLSALTNELGKRFWGVDIARKFYSSCRFTHQPIELAQNFWKEGVKPEDIDQITVKCGVQCYEATCKPVEEKRRPRTHVDVNFSTPFTVAIALVKGDVFINEVNDESIRDPVILEIAQRVVPVIDPERQTELTVGSVEMELKMKDGQVLVKESKYPKGNPQNPVSMDDCIDKFRKAASHSRIPFPSTQLSEIVDIVNDLEDLENVNQLVGSVVPHGLGS